MFVLSGGQFRFWKWFWIIWMCSPCWIVARWTICGIREPRQFSSDDQAGLQFVCRPMMHSPNFRNVCATVDNFHSLDWSWPRLLSGVIPTTILAIYPWLLETTSWSLEKSTRMSLLSSSSPIMLIWLKMCWQIFQTSNFWNLPVVGYQGEPRMWCWSSSPCQTSPLSVSSDFVIVIEEIKSCWRK